VPLTSSKFLGETKEWTIKKKIEDRKEERI
jgi:hypothetical protein